MERWASCGIEDSLAGEKLQDTKLSRNSVSIEMTYRITNIKLYMGTIIRYSCDGRIARAEEVILSEIGESGGASIRFIDGRPTARNPKRHNSIVINGKVKASQNVRATCHGRSVPSE